MALCQYHMHKKTRNTPLFLVKIRFFEIYNITNNLKGLAVTRTRAQVLRID